MLPLFRATPERCLCRLEHARTGIGTDHRRPAVVLSAVGELRVAGSEAQALRISHPRQCAVAEVLHSNVKHRYSFTSLFICGAILARMKVRRVMSEVLRRERRALHQLIAGVDCRRRIAISLVIPAPLPVSESGVRRAVERSRFAAEPSVLQFREVKVHSTGPSSSRNDGAMQPLPRPTQNCCTAMKTHKAIVLPNPLKPHLKRTS